jgi:hypothetical protein
MNSKYDGSCWQLLSEVYPEYDWLPWKFSRAPRNIWREHKYRRMFLDWAGKQLGVKEYDDWLSVSRQVV